ncbi:MAG: ornithine cyclodeaminase family protein [Candidatus Aminicenantes bacterium 4484_214]|nr:MAG: ornithine cyclodeaminase family protein [Candidatus Aminicenantes bacterium 4484_214]RLE09497.1 MAG: ornithine cyclodeaminase family protein [Candidatus Aminicenantes bacterium]
MSKIYELPQIKEALKSLQPIPHIEEGFVAYSQGKAVIPPVGEMIFKEPPGDVHIKYGYLLDDDYYAIKIASGFFETPSSTRYTSDGLILVFKKGTGELACALLDKCYLTNVRTAAAGAVSAKYLAPKKVECIGVLGAGVQGRMQVEYLASITDCKEVMVWGMNQNEVDEYKKDMEPLGYRVRTTLNTQDIPANCNLIVTATPSKAPLLSVDMIRKGTHITAMGSDTPEKQELDPKILQKADIVVADSINQCLERGEIHKALEAGVLEKERIVELGEVIVHPELGRTSEDQITVADLTGVAVQDIQIAKAVYYALEGKE